MQVGSLCREDPLEEGTATLSSILAWRIPMDRGAWQATVHGGHKELDTAERACSLAPAPGTQVSLSSSSCCHYYNYASSSVVPLGVVE